MFVSRSEPATHVAHNKGLVWAVHYFIQNLELRTMLGGIYAECKR
jgi:hypothetical protein